MSNNFELGEYNITTTLTDLSVFMRILNNVSYKSYENTIHLSDINLPFEKHQIYDILTNCFNKKESYDVVFISKNNALDLTFNLLFDGIFKSTFNITLPEMKTIDDSNLILNINKMEVEYKKEIKSLKTEIQKMKADYDKYLSLNIHNMEFKHKQDIEIFKNEIEKMKGDNSSMNFQLFLIQLKHLLI